jgi:hypothetical protein
VKTVGFLLSVMTAAVLLLGASLGQQADRLSQQSPLQSGENSAHQQKDEVRNDEDQAHPKPADETQEQAAALTRSTTKRRPSTSSKHVPTYQARSVRKPPANSPRIDEPGSIAPLEQMSSKTASNTPKKAVSRRSSSGVSVNGQQFKNSRDPGAHLAASGGPATTARGTAAINGTEMKRKP